MTRFPLLHDNIIYIQLPDALESQNSPILAILNLRSKSARFSEHPFSEIYPQINSRMYIVYTCLMAIRIRELIRIICTQKVQMVFKNVTNKGRGHRPRLSRHTILKQ